MSVSENTPKPSNTSALPVTWATVVFAAVVCVLLALLVKLFLIDEVSASLVTAIAALTGLLILSPRVNELAELSFSKDGLVAKLRDVEQKVESAENSVKQAEKKIDQLFASTMSDAMFHNLKKLRTDNFGEFRNNGGLRRELRHLRDIGYITATRHIGDIPENGPNLSDYVRVTPAGSDFVDFRESLESVAGPQK